MSWGSQHDGGLSVTPQMREILGRSGFISITMGSEALRNMVQEEFSKFDVNKLSLFALACVCGRDDAVKQAVETGAAPDLTTTQTPFQLGFVALTVLGAQRLRPASPDTLPGRHSDTIRYLIDAGAPPDVPDLLGHTSLHHACTPPIELPEVAQLLLEKGANVNAQNRYGEVPVTLAFVGGNITLVDLLMERDADLDIADGNGDTPRKLCLTYGAKVTAAVQRWDRKRKGEEAPWEEKRCENCKTKQNGLKQCKRCHLVRYCSTECQRAHWKVHKPVCNPFSAATTVTLRPSYDGVSGTISTADLARRMHGVSSSSLSFKPGLTMNVETENKSMVIKIQVPVSLTGAPVASAVNSPFNELFIYDKKRDFACRVSRASNPDAYDAVVQVVRNKGVGGAKAYFAAKLKNPNELVVKISEVLAEQPF